jgi:5-formyltetrahydrofolate cyclo-ligase
MTPNFDSDEVASLRKQAKKALRKQLATLRHSLPERAAAERSARVVARLATHPFLQATQGVALYAAMSERREVDLSSLHDLLHARGARIYYPFMDPEVEVGSSTTAQGQYTTGFRLWQSGDVLEKRGQYFVEPDPSRPIAKRGDVDVIIVPALGVTVDGYRLGFGAGFYDATLPDLCPPAKTICVGYDFQLLIELPIEPHDFRCDAVITDAANE